MATVPPKGQFAQHAAFAVSYLEPPEALFDDREWPLGGPAGHKARHEPRCLTALRAGPPFSWGVTSGGPPGGRSLSKDGTRADSAKDFCRLVGGVYYAGNLISDLTDDKRIALFLA